MSYIIYLQFPLLFFNLLSWIQSPVHSSPVRILSALLTFRGVSPKIIQRIQRCLGFFQGTLRDFSTFLFVFVMVHATMEWSASPELDQPESIPEVWHLSYLHHDGFTKAVVSISGAHVARACFRTLSIMVHEWSESPVLYQSKSMHEMWLHSYLFFIVHNAAINKCGAPSSLLIITHATIQWSSSQLLDWQIRPQSV